MTRSSPFHSRFARRKVCSFQGAGCTAVGLSPRAAQWCTIFSILSIPHHALSALSSMAMQISGRPRRAQSPTADTQSTVKSTLYSQVAWSRFSPTTRHGHAVDAAPWRVGAQQSLHARGLLVEEEATWASPIGDRRVSHALVALGDA